MHDSNGGRATPGRFPRRVHLGATALLTTVTIVTALVAAPLGAADDRFTAGGRVTSPVRATSTDLAPALDRAAAVAQALGFPAGRLAAARVHDAFAHLDLDEVTTFDAADRPVAIQRFDRSGRLALAVRLGWSKGGATVPSASALARARAALRAVHLDPSGPGGLEPDPSGDGWTVRWPRLVDGVPVLGDGVTVRLWSDGSVHAIAATESPLAARPPMPMDDSRALETARRIVAAWDAAATVANVDAVHLGWVAPNDLFDPGAGDAPAPELRLSWIADVTPVGELASRVRAIQLYIDAGDGRPLGGDVLE
jgi:hypothetical protein